MRKILFFAFIAFSFQAFSYAYLDTQKYAVERPDGGVTIIYYVPGSNSLTDILHSMGFDNYPVSAIADADMSASKKDRKYWKKELGGKKIVVDQAKKQADLDLENQKETELQAVLGKLKITKDEFAKLKELK